MAEREIEKTRNLALIAHSGAGKTTLVEAILFNAGTINRMGTIEDGNTVTDFDPEEIDRQHTISSAVAYCDWNDYRINLIDTPGFINFIEDAKGCIRVSDAVLAVVSATTGMRAETEKGWQFATDFGLPGIVFVNDMDKDNADFAGVVKEVETSFGIDAIPLIVPIGAGENFSSVIDILNMKAYKTTGKKPEEIDIPADMKDTANEYRKKLVEKVAEADDNLIEKYLEGEELTTEEITKGINDGACCRNFVPVCCGSASKNIAIPHLIDAIILSTPSPIAINKKNPIKGKNPKDGSDVERTSALDSPFSAYIFKTIADPFAGKLSLFRVFSGELKADSNYYNSTKETKERVGQIFYMLGKKQVSAHSMIPGDIGVVAKLKESVTGDTLCDESNHIILEQAVFAEPLISYAIEPKSKGDEDKVSVGLHKILDEDPTLQFHRDEESNEMIISGMGQVHVEISLQKLKRKFGVEVEMHSPKIPYRETITKATKAQGKYKKQSGGRGQYGDCWITLEPLPKGGGFEFVDKIVGGAIPRSYIPAVEKGIVEKMKTGLIAGYPAIDMRVTLFDGSYHTVDSSEMAFKIAGSMAIKKAAQSAAPVLLEPVVKAEITIPEDNLGAVIGDLNSKRGKVQGVDTAGNNQKIEVLVPMSEMLTYANQLQSLTSGRGTYHMEFSHYEEAPHSIAQKIIEERKKEESEE